MSIQSWVTRKLAPTYIATPEATHGLRVRGNGRELGVYCVEPGSRFGVAELEQTILEMPDCEFVVLIRAIADSEVYTQMRSHGLYVGRLGELESVLGTGIDPALYEGREEAYLLRRLRPNPHVVNVERCGQVAFRVIRRRGLRPITIVTFEAYELTADAAYQLLEEHPDISLDAMVSTNPRCNGFAPSVLEVTSNTNVRLVPLRDFLRSLGDTWDETD